MLLDLARTVTTFGSRRLPAYIKEGVITHSSSLPLTLASASASPSASASASAPTRWVEMIDRSATPPEKDAASSDINKIVRGDYSDATYAELALLALEKWMGDEEWKEHFHQSGSE